MMGFLKNILDTSYAQMKNHMLVELWELIKLSEATSWSVAKAAYITQMHAIEDSEITTGGVDRGALLQRRMIETHVGVFAPYSQKAGGKSGSGNVHKKLICKFFRAGSCR